MSTQEFFEQERYLAYIIRNHVPCTIIMTNGYQMHDAVIHALSRNGDAMLVSNGFVKEQMVYKHAISTIRPAHPVQPAIDREETTGGDNDG